MPKYKFRLTDKVRAKSNIHMGSKGTVPKGTKGDIIGMILNEYVVKFKGFNSTVIVAESELEKRLF